MLIIGDAEKRGNSKLCTGHLYPLTMPSIICIIIHYKGNAIVKIEALLLRNAAIVKVQLLTLGKVFVLFSENLFPDS